MALPTYYDDGTATVGTGELVVTFTGASLLANVRENDIFWAKGLSVRAGSIDAEGQLTLASPWPGPALNGDFYEIHTTPVASFLTASVLQLLEKLSQGLWLTPNATGTLAERAGYDSARRGFIYMQTDADPFVVFVKQTDTVGDWSPGYSPQQGPQGEFTTIQAAPIVALPTGEAPTIQVVQAGTTATFTFSLPTGPRGYKGWTPVTVAENDGADRVVLRIIDFIDGEGDKPIEVIGKYIGDEGFVDTANLATNVMGPVGPQGPAGVLWRGDWDSTFDYSALDVVVALDGAGELAAWISRTANINKNPADNPTDWDLFPASFPDTNDYGRITDAATNVRDYGVL